MERVTTPPDYVGTPIVSAADLRTWLRDSPESDAFLLDLQAVAVGYIEQITWRKIGDQTVQLILDHFPAQRSYGKLATEGVNVDRDRDVGIVLYGPVQSITSIETTDQDGVDTLVDSAEYRLDNSSDGWPARVFPVADTLRTWPLLSRDYTAVKIIYQAGYATVADVPMQLKQAVKAMVAWMHEHRGDCADACACAVSCGAMALLHPYSYREM